MRATHRQANQELRFGADETGSLGSSLSALKYPCNPIRFCQNRSVDNDKTESRDPSEHTTNRPTRGRQNNPTASETQVEAAQGYETQFSA